MAKKKATKAAEKPAARRATTLKARPTRTPKARTAKTSAAKNGTAVAKRASEAPAAAASAPATTPSAPARSSHGPGSRANGQNNGAAATPPSPPPQPVTFNVGDKAVHPAHGVGEVTAIEQRELGGTRGTFYVLRILDNGMKVMVPTAATASVGLRGIMSPKEADAILGTMRAREVAVDVQPWSRRFRVYTEMIKSGSPIEVAKVLRDMNRLKFDKDLSFGERRLLDQARSLLMKELAFAKKMSEQQMAEEISRIFSA